MYKSLISYNSHFVIYDMWSIYAFVNLLVEIGINGI